MRQSESLQINAQGHLTIGGLAREYGTPLYVLDETGVRAACRIYRDSIDRFYGGRGMVCYASKAFCCKEICRIMHDEGMGLDVVSEGELYTALSAGFPAEKICFHGNNKTDSELLYALRENVGLMIVDNDYELERLNRFAGEMGKRPNIAFRIKPGVDAHTHNFVRTGQIDSKFGVALENGEAFALLEKAAAYVTEILKAMGLTDCDVLAPGKQADLIVIDLQRPNMQPVHNVARNLVYSGSKDCVRLTLVGGRILYENGEFHVGDSVEHIIAEAEKYTEELIQ